MSNHFQVALENREIGHVESSEGGIQSDIGLGDMVAEQVDRLSGGEMGLQTIKRLKQCIHIGVVCLLGGCKAALVDPVIDSIVNPLVHVLNVVLFVARQKWLGGLAQGWIDEGIKGRVEHADDLRRLIVDDRLALAVP